MKCIVEVGSRSGFRRKGELWAGNEGAKLREKQRPAQTNKRFMIQSAVGHSLPAGSH